MKIFSFIVSLLFIWYIVSNHIQTAIWDYEMSEKYGCTVEIVWYWYSLLPSTDCILHK